MPPDTPPPLRFLSLDRAGLGPASGLSALKDLTNLRVLSLSHNELDDVAPLAGLRKLQILNLSDNDIGAIGPLAGQQIINDGGTGYREMGGDWLHNSRPVLGSEAFRQDYAFHAGTTGDDPAATARWTFTDLVPGRYEVFVTWPEHASRANNAPYQVLGVAGEPIIEVNQRRAPDGERLGGRPWQSLGVFTITGDTLRVVLSSAANGSIAADAVRIVARQWPTAGLTRPEVLNLTDNPLDNDAHQFFVPILEARDTADKPKFTFDFDENDNAPRWVPQSRFGPQGSRGEGISLLLTGTATDPDNDPLTFTAESSNPDVAASIDNGQLFLTPLNSFNGTAQITVTVHDDVLGVGDPHGRTAVQTFDFNVNVGAVYGNKWHDENRNGDSDAGRAWS